MTQTPISDCQPRFQAYCIANGAATREEMFARDGNAAKFMWWVMDRWREWGALVGHNGKHRSEKDHEDFDKWLFEQVRSKG